MNEADDGHGPLLLLSLHSTLIFMTVVMIATTTCHHYPGRGSSDVRSAAKVMPRSLLAWIGSREFVRGQGDATVVISVDWKP
jgi:hypothetical protein